MCLDAVAPARHISRDLLLWVGGPTILLNEGIHRGIDRVPFGSPLSPACPPCWEEAAGVGWSSGTMRNYHTLRLPEPQFSHL